MHSRQSTEKVHGYRRAEVAVFDFEHIYSGSLATEKGDSKRASYPAAWEAKCRRKRCPPGDLNGNTQKAEGHQLIYLQLAFQRHTDVTRLIKPRDRNWGPA